MSLLEAKPARSLGSLAAEQPCPAEGDAKPGTVAYHMNPYKNRTQDPGQTNDVEVDQILSYASAEDEGVEQQGVVLRGQLLTYKHEGPESPNCGSDTREDYHIWLGPISEDHRDGERLSPAELKSAKLRSVVVELTPDIQDQHPEWGSGLGRFRYKYVCVRGWMFFDQDHGDQVGQTRGTQWEVHPVTDIGLLKSDGTCSFSD